MGEIAHVGAAVLLAHRHAEQAEIAEFLPQVGGEKIVAVDLGGARRDFGVGEGAHGFAQHDDFFAEMRNQGSGWSRAWSSGAALGKASLIEGQIMRKGGAKDADKVAISANFSDAGVMSKQKLAQIQA